MNTIDIVIAALVVIAIVFVIVRIFKKGSCDCGCSSCGDSCHTGCGCGAQKPHSNR